MAQSVPCLGHIELSVTFHKGYTGVDTLSLFFVFFVVSIVKLNSCYKVLELMLVILQYLLKYNIIKSIFRFIVILSNLMFC